MNDRPIPAPKRRAAAAKPAKADSPPAWSVAIAATDIPETGRHVALAPDAAARDAIAEAADIVALPRLEAEFDLTRHGSQGVRVRGRVGATVVQACVVTLDPVEGEIDEPVDLLFLPAADIQADPSGEPPGDGFQPLETEDPPEALRDGTVDLGAIATEFLILGLDPYPRKPGAEFEPPAPLDSGEKPFAALAALKKNPGRNGG